MANKNSRIYNLINFNEYMYSKGSLGKRLRKNRDLYEKSTLNPNDSNYSSFSEEDRVSDDIGVLKDEVNDNEFSIKKYHNLFSDFFRDTNSNCDKGGGLASDITLIMAVILSDVRKYAKYIYNKDTRTMIDFRSRYMDQCLIPSVSKRNVGSFKVSQKLSCKVQNHVMNIIYNNHVMYNKKDRDKVLNDLKNLRKYFLNHQISYVLETLTDLTDLLTRSNPNGSRYCLNGKFPVNKHDTLMALNARYTVVDQVTSYLRHVTNMLINKHKDNIELLNKRINDLKDKIKTAQK